MHNSEMIMITCVMKAKENTRIILLYEKVQSTVKCFIRDYLIMNISYVYRISVIIHVCGICALIFEILLRKHNKTDCLLMTG